MDATVDDFLKEINEIVPPTQKTSENAWKECYDDQTGYPYYWNVNTDEVTWEVPPGFKHSQGKDKRIKKTNNLYIPPKTVPPICPAVLPVATDSIKIYKIQDEKPKIVDSEPGNITTEKTYAKSKRKRQSSDSGDEKIVLISSYGSDTESEQEETYSNVPKENVKQNKSYIYDGESEEEILNKIQHQAKVLKELGGKLPPEIEKLVDNEESDKKKIVSGIALVAGYGSDLDETDEEAEENLNQKNKPTSLFPIASQLPENVPRSTLFPVVEPIDVGQFLESNKDNQIPAQEDNVIDIKAFQRKRKIDVELVNAQKRLKPEDESSERRGFGFKSTIEYPGFKSGGMMFIKSDMLNANESEKSENVNEDVKKNSILLPRDFEDIRDMLNEKLTFLSEGHNPVPPVQVMLIQIETLNIALLDGSLNANYFKKWLTDTCTDLVKLEQEAAPNGWLLQWDRLNKRYYYRNKATGESQWEYPQPDIIRCDEAMDISTTPPPPPEDDNVLSIKGAPVIPPPPPVIRSCSPVPPPPPVISTRKKKDSSRKKNADPPLPPPESMPPLPPEKFAGGEPLPPGVDGSEIPPFNNLQQNEHKKQSNDDVLNSVLDSFYSDLAAISTDSQPVSVKEDVEEKVSRAEVMEQQNKKKKTKVKLTQGLAMKKKGVSKLVEKWKNVQRSLE